MKKKRRLRKEEKKMQQIRALPEGVIFRMSGLEIAKLQAHKSVIDFKTGAFVTNKDRPRNNDWRKWDFDSI